MRKLFVRYSLVMLIIGVAVFIIFLKGKSSQKRQLSNEEKIDELFSEWNEEDSPGAVCGVIQDGNFIYKNAFGMLNIENHEKMTTDAVFEMSSDTKQFTATCIGLLILDGKITLEDDIHKFFPEMTGIKEKVTIGDLIYHVSGIRDDSQILWLMGIGEGSQPYDNHFLLQLLFRQKDLNFQPKTEFCYSNSNYVLLGEIVSRVSGKSLRSFAEERIFKPLGMKSTHYEDYYGENIPHRVIGYEVIKLKLSFLSGYLKCDPYSKNELDFGSKGVLSTVDDLFLWDQNFYSKQVGGDLLEKLRFREAKLIDGHPVNYYFGLTKGAHRGVNFVNHSGLYNGFVSDIVRFPEQRFTVIILANTQEIEPTKMAFKIADIYLKNNLEVNKAPKKVMEKKAVVIPPDVFDEYVGEYEVEGKKNFTLSYRREGTRFFARATGQKEFEIFPLSESRFFLKAVEAEVEFHRDVDRKVHSLSLYQGGQEFKATRKGWIRPEKSKVSDKSVFVGNYWSEELQSWLTISLKNEKLFLYRPKSEPLELTYEGEDILFFADFKIKFNRNEFSQVNGFNIDWSRIRHVRFERLP